MKVFAHVRYFTLLYKPEIIKDELSEKNEGYMRVKKGFCISYRGMPLVIENI